MADTSVTLGEWLSIAVTTVLAAVGGAVGGATYLRKKVDTHILDDTEKHGKIEKQLAVLETMQSNNANQLERIQQSADETNSKLDRLIDKFVDTN